MNSIPFNKPFLSGKEISYIEQSIQSGRISGDGMFTKKCHDFFEKTYGFKKCLLTTSCTDALEMAAILINIKADDEVIVPSYTFVSTANAFVKQGAKVVFADSCADNPNLDPAQIEALITHRTRAIVPVHYAGIACNMDAIMAIAAKYNLYVIEDAALSIDSYYQGKPLGTIGHLAAFSFHETKNVISGEGGMLAINDERFIERAEIIREKGTNRSKFFRGEVDKYNWVDIGSSFLPSDMIAAFLYAQLECLPTIQQRRKEIWEYYYKGLQSLQESRRICLPQLPAYATNNASMFYFITGSLAERTALISRLKQHGISAVFHYLSLHQSPFFENLYGKISLPQADHFSETLLRLPFYYELTFEQQDIVIDSIHQFYKSM